MTAAPAMSTLRDLFAPPLHLQRSINLRYDLGAADYVATYVPTPRASEAIIDLLASCAPGVRQRAHVLVGAYGVGKSLFAVTLAALLSRDEAAGDALAMVRQRLSSVSPDASDAVSAHLETGPRLLPVVLTGEEGDLGAALARALQRAIERAEIVGLHPPTSFRGALETIGRWRVEHPDAYARLRTAIEAEDGATVSSLEEGLQAFSPPTLDRFARHYEYVTAGATFAPHAEHGIAEVLAATAGSLHSHGYDGLVVIHDEFGRFLDAHVGQPFGSDAQILQDLAERANRSHEGQLHLVLVTHKGLRQYAMGLPDEAQREWARIEQRFRSLDLSGDPDVAYHLIASALSPTDREEWAALRARHAAALDLLAAQTSERGLYKELDAEAMRGLIVEGAYPLHPLASYCLPRLSERVAQNERTLFTFLASEDDLALPALLSALPADGDDLPLVRPHDLYGYFAPAMKVDTGPGGTHPIWAAAEAAVRKLADDAEACMVAKALAVLLVVAGDATPSTQMLSFAIGAPAEPALDRLKARKAAVYRRTEGYWRFVEGSDVDIEREVTDRAGRMRLTPTQLRQHVERAVPPRHQPARRYNDRYEMTRFFRSIYRTPAEVSAMSAEDWDSVLRDQGYADGLLVCVLVTNEPELRAARAALARQSHPRVVFVLADAPLPIAEPLREVLALDSLDADPALRESDERVGRELAYYAEEAKVRLERALLPLLDPRYGAHVWVGGSAQRDRLTSPGVLSRILSEALEATFDQTPIIANEGLNRRSPTGQQIRAAEKVIDALLREPLQENLGLTGYGPDVAIMRTVLLRTGVLRGVDEGAPRLGAPALASAMGRVWAAIDEALKRAEGRTIEFDGVLDLLQWPPFGLRRGVLPVLLAACMRRYLDRAIVTRGGEVVSPLVGVTFTDICVHPDLYALHLEPMDERRAAVLRRLDDLVGARVQPEEKRSQPLRYLGLGLLRWLQALPRYARDTRMLSPDALRLRRLIQLVATQPARSLLVDLPDLLFEDYRDHVGADEYVRMGLMRLMAELEGAHAALVERVDRWIADAFDGDEIGDHGRDRLAGWLRALGERSAIDITTHLFNDAIADILVATDSGEIPAGETFAEYLGRRVVGLPLRDWSDHTEEEFRNRLAAARDRMEAELGQMRDGGERLVEVTICLSGVEQAHYRFREADLSLHAKNLLTNLKNTMDITGRALSIEERRRIGLELLAYVLDRRG